MKRSHFRLELRPRIPEKLSRLKELANNLLYSWDRSVRSLFVRLDRDLWVACAHNPKLFLRRVAQQTLDQAAQDSGYLEEYQRVLTSFDTYLMSQARPSLAERLNPETELIAYFCAEFGLHESFPIYSGGLGILAGDHCKAASDLSLPFVAVGLLYEKGYFVQSIDENGQQQAEYISHSTEDMPISKVLDDNNEQIKFAIRFPGREVAVSVWKAMAGHISLYLLDTNLPENNDDDKAITHQLYGGGDEMRIKQEIILGIGGVKALKQLDIKPSVWHINEGHAAFQLLERYRDKIHQGMTFEAAKELVAANTIFTTHTPVPAGHDIFSIELMAKYFSDYANDLKIEFSQLFALGNGESGFNMTSLALRGTRFHNGVSAIHGQIASHMEGKIWSQIPSVENPITSITNGVHLPTFLAKDWMSLFNLSFDDWQNRLLDADYWERIEEIPDYQYWSVHRTLKQQLLTYVDEQVRFQQQRNGLSVASITKMTQHLSGADDILVMGFARRFATYKRATILFSDPERLSRILNHPERPGIIIFAGKAHPNDVPGQELIRVIHEYSLKPEFIGKILLLEGYDLALARKLVSGVDVWLNTPEHPLEASGTSGQKAAMNGAVNVSVLDGWWAEGYDGNNGWGITPRDTSKDINYRTASEGSELLEILDKEVFPIYYDQNQGGYSERWVRISKASMKSIIPRFNAQRMLMDYVNKLYYPAHCHRKKMAANNAANAIELAEWKAGIFKCWHAVTIRMVEQPPEQVYQDEKLTLKVAAQLDCLERDDVIVECLFGHDQTDRRKGFNVKQKVRLEWVGEENGEAIYQASVTSNLAGVSEYIIRMYPCHPNQVHPFELGLMLWI